MEKVIFFGNGPLAEFALAVIKSKYDVIFHAKTREDLADVCKLKRKFPEAHGVLASFGVLIKKEVLDLFEPEGILNIHPSLLPALRGASPIESAILAGDDDFSVSVMKLAEEMDAGQIYHQETLKGLTICKEEIYRALAEAGAKWITEHLANLPKATAQDDAKATFCGKFTKAMGDLTPETDTAEQIFRKIVAFQGFPKPKYAFFGINCIILEAHIAKVGETAVLTIKCSDGNSVVVDRLQPEGRKAMDAKSFINGYKH